jgi:hypothetical protein
MTDPNTPAGEPGVPTPAEPAAPTPPAAPVTPPAPPTPAASPVPPQPPQYQPPQPPQPPQYQPPQPPQAPQYQAPPAPQPPQYQPPQPQQPAYGAQPFTAPPQQPAPYGQPAAYGQQPAPYGQPYVQQGASRTPVLSIISMIAGIVGLLANFAFGAGIILSVGAVVLGFLGKGREPQAKGFWLTGLITGFAGIAIAVIVWVVLIIGWIALAGTAATYSNLG